MSHLNPLPNIFLTTDTQATPLCPCYHHAELTHSEEEFNHCRLHDTPFTTPPALSVFAFMNLCPGFSDVVYFNCTQTDGNALQVRERFESVIIGFSRVQQNFGINVAVVTSLSVFVYARRRICRLCSVK